MPVSEQNTDFTTDEELDDAVIRVLIQILSTEERVQGVACLALANPDPSQVEDDTLFSVHPLADWLGLARSSGFLSEDRCTELELRSETVHFLATIDRDAGLHFVPLEARLIVERAGQIIRSSGLTTFTERVDGWLPRRERGPRPGGARLSGRRHLTGVVVAHIACDAQPPSSPPILACCDRVTDW